ncbi:hypothetical protein C7B69_01790, partial [filamentous cyanobacterium Phorm 46]
TAASENVAVTTATTAVKTPEKTPNNTDSVSEIKQPVKTEFIVSQSADAELIKTDKDATSSISQPPAETESIIAPIAEKSPAITESLVSNVGEQSLKESNSHVSTAPEQLPTKTESTIPTEIDSGTVENESAFPEITSELESELPTKTDSLSTAEFTAGTIERDITVSETAAELETEKSPALFSTPSETAAVTTQITEAEVETSVSPSTLKSPPEPTSNNYNSNSSTTETVSVLPAYSDTEIAPKSAEMTSGLLLSATEKSAQISDNIADTQPNSTQRTGDIQRNTNPPTNLSITAASNSPNPGTFLVDDQGQVKFDYQFDGGYFTGEVGIFSLSGMEAFTPGTPEFIAEAARRVLSNSTDGHVVIRDSTEGAKFTGSMPGEYDFGSGEYQGIKTFNMTPGDTFAVMFVPSGTVQSSLQYSWLWDLFPENRPLFSIATANPNDTAHLLQIADITGTGNTFALEDMSPPNSDRDYNDLIFKISGAIGNAPLLDTVINPDKEWRNTALGQQLLAEANPPNSDNNPPVVSPTSARTYTELETTISLENLATDAEGDPLTISVLNPVNGTVIFNPLTNKASFKPATGFSGIASFDFLASDAFGSSTPARVTVNVSDVPLLNLDFVKRNPILNAGENTELVVFGDFADQKGVVLPDSYLTYTSINPEVAPIDAAGQVTGLTNGTSILSASRNNLQAVTPIRIGTMPAPTTNAQLHQILAEMYGLDPYPDAVSLIPGGTRKLSLGLNSNFTEANLTAASTGTRYFSNNSNILNVSSDGTITAVGIGDATVTAIHGTASATIPVRVEAPKIGTTALGTDGGIINSSDGTLAVMIPPGALKQNATVSIAPVNQQNLSLPLPPGFEFAGVFNLNFSDNFLNIPAQLAIPAPAGLAPGTVAYFLRKGAIPDATGTWNPIWLQEESGIVGDDGNIRTQSPPYPGVVRPGEYAVVYSSPTGSATLVKGQLTLNYNFPLAFFGIIDPLGNIGQLIDPDKFVTTPAFTVTRDISSVQVVAIPKVGLPVITEVGVQRNDDGTATFKAALNMPAPTSSDPTTPPVLQKAELKFKDENNQQFENNEPLLFLTGGNILVNNASDSKGSRFEDLVVEFQVGNQVYSGTILPNRSRSVGGNQFEVAVQVPNTLPLGASGIVLTRKQNQLVEQNGTAPVYKPIEYSSNPIRLPQGAEYVFATQNFPPINPKSLSELVVIKGSNPKAAVEATSSKDLLISRIPVGSKSTDAAEASAVTGDGTRVYVVLRESGGVAMVDPMVLRQVDTQPDTPGVNPIVLPAGAKPKSIAIDPRDNYAYIADRDRGDIYVLDIDPFSATYHQVIKTINVGSNTTKLRNLAISSDGRKLFATASDNYIYAVNIDPKDRPNEPNSNPRKWQEKIGAIAGALGPTGPLGVTGLAATSNPKAMIFTSGNTTIDAKGYGVLEIASDDPLNFTATNRYIDLSLGSTGDYFDVNEGVSVTVMRDGRYAFVAGRNNRDNVALFPDPRSGSNIGIIKDPLGPNPQLVAATRPIPGGLTNDLVLSNDNKSLFSSYPAPSSAGSVYAFDVEEMIKTLDNPGQFQIDSLDRGVKSPFFTTGRAVTNADFARVPIDDINPAISIAADYGITKENRPANQFTYGVLPQTTRAPVGTGGNLRDLSIAPTDWLNLKGPGATTSDLTPTFQWQFAPGWENVKEVNLFVSTFEQGKGLLPWDKVVDLSDSALLPGFSETQKRQLLSKPWNGYDDFNPNRILTATWKKETGKWYGHDGITPLNQPLNDPANTSTNFTLPQSLTAGQNYNFAVEAVSNSGAVTKDLGQFKTLLPPSNSPFSSVSVLTHGFTLLPGKGGIPDSFYEVADSIAKTGNDGLILRYEKPTGSWIPIDKNGGVLTTLTGGLQPTDTNYFLTLTSNIQANYVNQNKSLVLLPEWSLDRESVIPDVGFSEGAADALFASMVQLDLALGGGVGEYQGNQLKRLYDSQGKLIRQQGDLFNSPLHFMGFSRGTVVNSEIVQRLGTFFPQAGGKSMANRDLQMTTIDPHDFYQPSLELKLPDFISTNFSDFYEPKVQVWNNVTFADNYYQTVADPNGVTATPNGRNIPYLPIEELNKNPRPVGLNFPLDDGITLGHPDLEVLLGTREGQPGRANSRIGFTKDDGLGSPHTRTWSWYAGTVDLDISEVRPEYPHASNPNLPEGINDQLGDQDTTKLFDPNFPNAKPWYSNSSGEGVGEGWFYSVLGGGKDKRPDSPFGRVPVSFDNTLSGSMRGDFAVPTLFNGNFDQFIPNKSDAEDFGRNLISKEIPGWSLHNGANSTLVSPTNNLVDWSEIPSLNQNRLIRRNPTVNASYLEQLSIDSNDPTRANYTLKLEDGDTIVHNRFVIPEWGALRFNLHVPTLNNSGTVRVSIKGDAPDYQTFQELGTVQLTGAAETGAQYSNDRFKIGFGTQGFETFQVDIPNELRGKVATIEFEVNDGTVYLDDVFFKSAHLNFGNPTEARYLATLPSNNPFSENLLIEKPQYAVSYNEETKTPNWVSWQLNQSWLGTVPRHSGFLIDSTLPTGWTQIQDQNYTNSGYDRGHMIPSNNRTRNRKDNIATFLMTNVLPQAADNNRFFTPFPTSQAERRSAWYNFENFTRDLAYNGQEMYVIAGGYGDNITAQAQSNILPNMPAPETDPAVLTTQGIQIPEWTWKVVLVLDHPGQGLEELTADTPIYAILTPNTPEPTLNEFQNNSVAHPLNALFPDLLPRDNITSQAEWRQWETWQISVKQLEELLNSFSEGLNFNFLSAARTKIEQALENSQTPVINLPNFDPDPDDTNE